jgi:hypothetical protein
VRQPQLSGDTLFGDVAGELILFRPDFGQGGERHCHDVFSKAEVGSVVVSVAFLLI